MHFKMRESEGRALSRQDACALKRKTKKISSMNSDHRASHVSAGTEARAGHSPNLEDVIEHEKT